jgi:putative FmdB family regulatory protein
MAEAPALMPLFEYRCQQCGEDFERLERHSSAAARCPACGGDDLEKLISRAAVSSEHTQKRALDGAKKRIAGQRYDHQYEQHKQYHDHDAEPHDH